MSKFISSKYFRCVYNDANEKERIDMFKSMLKRKYIPFGLEKFFRGIYHNSPKKTCVKLLINY